MNDNFICVFPTGILLDNRPAAFYNKERTAIGGALEMDLPTNCIVQLQSLLPSLQGVERKASAYILEHPADAMAMPVARLARQACVSESSVIRLCQRLGFTGYAAFKLSLAASLSAAGLDRTLDDLTIEEGEMTPARVMTRVFEQTRQALEQTMLILSPEQFARAAKLLQNAASVTFFGIGTSAPVAQDACYRFSRLPLRVNCAVDPYMMVLLASRMGPGDVAVAISHTGQSRETLRAAEQARQQGAQVICITSYLDSPITRLAQVQLVTSSAESSALHEAIASRVTHISVLDSLYAALALNAPADFTDTLRHTNELMQQARR